MKKKTNLSRIWTGVKLGCNTRLSPPKLLALHNYPLVCVFRVIGGLSELTVLLKKHLLLYLPLQYLVLLLALVQIIYIVIISIIKIIYGISKFWTDDLNVRNSPLDQLASLSTKFLYCWKIGCKVGYTGIGLAGASVITYTILEAGGQEKVFTPLLGKGVKFIIGNKPADSIFANINKDIKNVDNSKDILYNIKKLSEQCESSLNTRDLSKDDVESIKSALDEIKKLEKSKLQYYAKDLAQKIKEY
jgi:hypothetical protein